LKRRSITSIPCFPANQSPTEYFTGGIAPFGYNRSGRSNSIWRGDATGRVLFGGAIFTTNPRAGFGNFRPNVPLGNNFRQNHGFGNRAGIRVNLGGGNTNLRGRFGNFYGRGYRRNKQFYGYYAPVVVDKYDYTQDELLVQLRSLAQARAGLIYEKWLGSDYRNGNPRAAGDGNEDFLRVRGEFRRRAERNTCPVCLGLPGALPVLNKRVVELGAKAALSLGLNVNETSIFARKNYFYPDLPKGYQISQYDKPFSSNGELTIMTAERDESGRAVEWKPMTIRIERMHLEEDAGKNVHEGLPDVDKYSYVDLNRAGTPLGEIVTAPDFRSSWQAYDYVNHVRRVLQWVGASDADMEKGNLRCEANVSVRKIGEEKFRNKVELKNLNSVRFMQKAIEYEIERQIAAHEAGETVNQETRLWDEKNNRTRVMRSKEDAHDYRYFPEPDLQPLKVSAEFIEQVKSGNARIAGRDARPFYGDYELSYNDASQLVSEKDLAAFYERRQSVE
jgi:hypothetical protein